MKLRIVYSDHFHKNSGSGKKGLLSRFDSHKEMIGRMGPWMEKNPADAAELSQKAESYFTKLDKLNFRDHVVAKSPYSIFGLILKSLGTILLLPLYLFGLINNYLIFKIPDYFVMTKIKDTQFRSSIAYVLAFVFLLPVLYTIQTILVAIFTTGWWIPFVYLFSLIPAGLFAIHYSFWYKKLRSRWKFVFLSSDKNSDKSYLIELRKSIVDSLDRVIGDKKSVD